LRSAALDECFAVMDRASVNAGAGYGKKHGA